MVYNILLSPYQRNILDTQQHIKQQDYGATFKMTVEDYDTTNVTCKIVFRRADGIVRQYTLNRQADGTFEYNLSADETYAVGKCIVDLKLYDINKRESTASFIYYVDKDEMGQHFESGDYFDSITEVIGRVEVAIDECEAITNEVEGKLANGEFDGFSSTIVANHNNNGDTYKLDITTKEGTITTPNLKGQDGTGAGDMTRAIYDPNNRAKDIFTELDSKVDKASIVNNALTTEEGTVLDGRVGKVLNDKIGNLSSLNTTSKTDLVSSVNEVKASVDVVNNNFVNIKAFGAKGDGVTDDTLVIQRCLNTISKYGGVLFFPDDSTYLISSQLTITPQKNNNIGVGSNLHFANNTAVEIHAPNGARIKAIASIDSIIRLDSNPNYTATAPYYFKCDGLVLDGNNLAQTGIYLKDSFHSLITHCRVFNTITNGIASDTCTGTQLEYNVIKSLYCINFKTGGDCYSIHNDLYPITNGVGIRMGGWTGNTHLLYNVVSCEDNSGDSIGILLDGRETYNATDGLIGNVNITGNEFSACKYGINALGKPDHKTIYNINISDNHFSTPFNTGIYNCIYLYCCYDIHIVNNYINALVNPNITIGLLLDNCDHVLVSDNLIINTTDYGIVLTDNCYNCRLNHNDMRNIAIGDATKAGVLIENSVKNRLHCNSFEYSVSNAAKIAIKESGTSNYNIGIESEYVNSDITVVKIGESSNFT